MYTHTEKTCINHSISDSFRRNKINTSDLWPPQCQELLIIAIGLQTLCTANYYLNTCFIHEIYETCYIHSPHVGKTWCNSSHSQCDTIKLCKPCKCLVVHTASVCHIDNSVSLYMYILFTPTSWSWWVASSVQSSSRVYLAL